jgi:hypothetical protein
MAGIGLCHGSLPCARRKARTTSQDCRHGTSLLDLKAALAPAADREEKDGLRIYALEAALIERSPQY